MVVVLSTLVLVGVMLALWLNTAGAGRASASEDTRPAPDFRLDSLDGEVVRLGDFAGRVLVLELWATWCGPCRLQAEILHEVYAEVAAGEVEFLAVSLGETRDTVERFVENQPFTYPVALDPAETLGLALEIFALPTVVIVDTEGRIRFTQPGITDAVTLRSVLRELGVEISA